MNSTITSLNHSHHKASKSALIAVLGVVFGDIGTSPLYTMKEAFHGTHAVAATPDNILGVLSLIFWAVMLIISLKYVSFMMRANNRGEGGIMALTTLIQLRADISPRRRALLTGLGLAGAALFYGDGIITPAISVLSAVEGLQILEPGLAPFVVPTALGVLVGLFSFQRKGTAHIGALFGPLMLAWFASLALFGLMGLAQAPEVLAAINPFHAASFLFEHQGQSLFALGAVVLAVTGGEALYADMGHFGREPIQKAWFYLVLPSLVLNYFGQGALLLHDPSAIRSPFYLLIPPALLGLMIVLATVVTIVASQAIISGAFSLTSQAIQLGFCPRLNIRHTSEEEMGQIYIPWINWALMLGIVALVLGFRSSSNLAAAYGIAVTGTMAIDTLLAFTVMRCLWRWPLWITASIALAFLAIDLTFLTANATKIPDGGWFPLLIALAVLYLLSTWKQGRDLLLEKLRRESTPVDKFLAQIAEQPPARVPGTAVFLTSDRDGIPPALMRNLKHNKMLHKTVIIMTVLTENVPQVAPERRRQVVQLADGLFRVVARYGFKETPNVPRLLKTSSRDFNINLADTTFFASRQTLLVSAATSGLDLMRLRLFISMARNTTSIVSFFRIPADRVVEIGVQIVL
jgi:KUP system potassium uptake protein